MKAIWQGEILAESDATVVVEGNHYFPASAIHWQFFKASDKNTVCPWKGTASYCDIEVNGKSNKDAAWYYAQPKSAASDIAGYMAFWKGVEVLDQ